MRTTSTKDILSIILLVAILFLVPLSFAQPGDGGKQDKVKQLKIAYITQELDLSTEEAEKFWPAYNEMEKEVAEEKKAQKKKSKYLRQNFNTLSDSDIEKKSIEIMDSEIKIAELNKKHRKKIGEIVGYKKMVKLIQVERQFKKELLKRINNRRPGQGGRPRGNGAGARQGRMGGQGGVNSGR